MKRTQSPQQRLSRLRYIDEEDLTKFNRKELLKIAKKMGFQIPYKTYLRKNYLIDMIKTTYQQEKEIMQKRGKSQEIKIQQYTTYTTKSGMKIRLLQPTIRKRSDATYTQLIRFLNRVKNLKKNHRQLINIVLKYEDGNYETIDVEKLLQRENAYINSAEINDYYICHIRIQELPQKGGCDTREHIVNSIHHLQDGSNIKLTLKTCKTTDNNCLINLFIKASGKKITCKKIRKELGLQEGYLEPENAEKLSLFLKVSYKIFAFQNSTIEIIAESKNQYNNYIEIYLDPSIGHYSQIMKRPDDLIRFKPQLQIEDSKLNIETGAERIIQISEEQQQETLPDYTHEIQYEQVLNDPNIEKILDLINNSKSHIFISGCGGVGKTYILRMIDNAIKTATTGLAATHINGNTIHYYLKTKFKDCENQNIIIDEISMMGTSLFQQVYKFIQQKNLRLIISGDILQLPPVDDGFFFQCYDFVKFAKQCIKINLTKIKRQNNVDQQEFLNNLRIGKVDKQYLKNLAKNNLKHPQVIICGKNSLVDKYNEEAIKQLTGQRLVYETQISYDYQKENEIQNQIKKVKKEYPSPQLIIGAKVMLIHNICVDTGLVNGIIGIIKEMNENNVSVEFSFGIRKIEYQFEKVDKITIKYMPLRLCYAITAHKSQGCTFDSAIIEIDDLFENGQSYVALSRVRDLNNLQIIGHINDIFISKAFRPNKIAYDFLYKNVMMTNSEIMMLEYSEKQLKGIKLKQWKETAKHWNHIYIDFETYLSALLHMQIQKPYYNKIKHIKNGKVIYEKTLFDQLWKGGQRCDVAGETWNYIKKVMVDHGDNLRRLKDKNTDNSIKIHKSERKKIPTLIAYNGSGFDFQFIMKRFLNDKTCSRRFEINNIFKGSRLIFLQIYDKYSGEIVLRTHDMAEILVCPLKKALTDFCKNNVDQQIVEKIEFKDEILYIMNNYEKNPEILKPDVESSITKRLFTQRGIIEKDTNKKISLYNEVIKYADNDVDVLPILYQCMDDLTKQALNTNITSFITAGSLAWYGLISNLPDECIDGSRYYPNSNTIRKDINSKLFRLEMKELEFVKKSIKGGRVCPRIHKCIPNEKYNYLDISGMYCSIMKNESMPYGKAKFLTPDQMKEVMKSIEQMQRQCSENKLSWRTLYKQITDKYGQFIAEVDFEENPMNLEPIIQYKHNGTTKYTVQRRIDHITSIDICLILASGGKIHDIKRVLQWEYSGNIMNKWIEKTLEHKNQGQRSGNSGLKAFGKLEANSTYGQSLKSDKNEVIRFINNFEEADEFVNTHQLTKFFDMDAYDVYVGKKQVSAEQFKTSRCQQIGSFVLAYARALVFDICEVAMPNRYNEKGVFEQPLYGDTDSLVFRQQQTELLIKAGWVKFENGKLTDELGEKSYWFLPERIQSKLEIDINKFDDLIQEQIWNEASEDEKRDPKNFHFYTVIDGIFAAPKSYTCKYSDPSGNIIKDKMKFKGIPTTALINDQTLDYDLIKGAYNNKDEQYIAVLQSKPQVIKNFSKKEESQAFLEIVDSNLRRDKFVQRQLFKTQWKGRYHLDDNYTVPYGWNNMNLLNI